MKIMINWQRTWDDDGYKSDYAPIKVVLRILSFFYLIIINLRNRLYDHKILEEVRLDCPVISVGNITVGGTGKTPCAIMIAKMLKEKGFKPAVISRGYGGANSLPVNIVSDGDKILIESDVAGDEPCLIADALKGVPVLIAAKRVLAGRAAIEKFGADVLICDDAMQHRQLFRDINLVLMDTKSLHSRYLLPRGRLREPLKELRRANAVLLTNVAAADEDGMARIAKIPVFRSIHRPEGVLKGDRSTVLEISDLQGKKVFAFCGIANPESFEKTLTSVGAKIVSFDVFPDHHRYAESELKKIRDQFKTSGADLLITTEKDGVRLIRFPGFLKDIYLLRVGMEMIPSPEPFSQFIFDGIAAAGKSHR